MSNVSLQTAMDFASSFSSNERVKTTLAMATFMADLGYEEIIGWISHADIESELVNANGTPYWQIHGWRLLYKRNSKASLQLEAMRLLDKAPVGSLMYAACNSNNYNTRWRKASEDLWVRETSDEGFDPSSD